MSERPLSGQVALVAGATRGAGRAIAVELARAGFFVYATGRSSRSSGPSEIGRPETIEETGELMAAAGGAGSALVVDHEDPAAVAELVASIEREQGRLDVLVNDIFGGDRYMEWDKPLWEHDWARRPADAADGRAHAPDHLPGGDPADAAHRRRARHPRPGRRDDRRHLGGQRRVPAQRRLLLRPRQGQRRADREGPRPPSWRPPRHGGRRDARAGCARSGCWRTSASPRPTGATPARERPGFAISESPTYVARGVAALARADDADRWAGTIISARQLADAYGITDTDGSRPDCWGHLAAYGWEHEDGAASTTSGRSSAVAARRARML